MNKKNSDELLEIYKIHVEIADKVSERRGKANQFYVSLLSALLVGIGFYLKELIANPILKTEIFLIIVSILGILLCIQWWLNILSYRQINSGKFLILHELEINLQFQFYKREWEMLGEGKKPDKYYQATRLEQFSPILMSIPYIVILIFSIINL